MTTGIPQMPDPLKSLVDSIADTNSDRSVSPEQWAPPFCGDIDMRICHDGHWEYMGTPIARESMVRLFASVLRREDNDYYLVTPVEKVRIQVDDVPFIVTGFQQYEGVVIFTTNVGDCFALDTRHPLKLSGSNSQPVPYIRVRNRLDARLHRNVFYQLVDISEEREENGVRRLYVASGNGYYSLGEL